MSSATGEFNPRDQSLEPIFGPEEYVPADGDIVLDRRTDRDAEPFRPAFPARRHGVVKNSLA